MIDRKKTGFADMSDQGARSEVGEDLGVLEEDQVSVVDTSTPHRFGTFAHEAYQVAVGERFDDVDHNVPVIVTKPDGSQAQGYIDTLINDRVIIDYKTNYMPGWSISDAVRYGHEHGRQVQEYVQSEGTPADARGWIIATVPPESADVRTTYVDTAAQYDVGVKFAGEDTESVVKAVSEAVAESDAPQAECLDDGDGGAE